MIFQNPVSYYHKALEEKSGAFIICLDILVIRLLNVIFDKC